MHTVAQASKLLGVNRQRIHYLMKRNRLPAERFGHIWMITSLRIKPGKNGRPKKDG